MKSIYKYILTGAMLSACATGAMAQNAYSGYFLENYNYRFMMNPAMGNEKNFVSMPALGSMSINFLGNLNLDNVLFVRDGKTVLFTNPQVSEAEAMKGLGKSPKFNFNIKEQILGLGFKAFGGYNTLSISAVGNAHIGITKEFFSLAKEGLSNRTYDLSDMSLRANAYAEIALGHSHDLSKFVPGLRIGGTLKVLLGVGNMDVDLHTAELELGRDNWIARTNADIYASVKGMRFQHKYNETTGKEYVSGVEIDGFGPQGLGFGVDLGATYKFRDFTFSAAVIDLGYINYPETRLASTDGLQTIETDAYMFNIDKHKENSIDNEIDRLKDDAYKLYQLSDKGDIGARSRSLATTLNFGVGYEFPMYRNLHFGLVNTTRCNGPFTTTDFRISANVRPVKCFAADVNVVVGTYGAAFGWMANLNVPGFNLFIGMDRTLSKLTKQGIPLKSSANINLGLNFPF